MAIYAACMTGETTRANAGKVRQYLGGSSWTDITANLNALVPAAINGWLISDLLVHKAGLFALITAQTPSVDWPAFIIKYDGNSRDWSIVTYSRTGSTLSGFYTVGKTVYVHGSASGFTNFVMYTFDPTRGVLTQLAQDGTGYFDRTLAQVMAWPLGVLQSPTNPDHLILGDAFEDDWGWYEISTNTFHMGSNPGGSCIFAMGVDDAGATWSGDYAALYYVSTDGGHTFSTAEIDFGRLPEIWQFLHYRGELYGVGCGPFAMIKRTTSSPTAPLDQCWEVVFTDNTKTSAHGIGMICALSIGNSMLIGCGGEPYYYLRDGSDIATVHLWNGLALNDAGGGLNWGFGVHLLRGEGTPEIPLRLNQRNDNLGISQHPRLFAGSNLPNRPQSVQQPHAPRMPQNRNTYS